jgi:hypothetical protein
MFQLLLFSVALAQKAELVEVPRIVDPAPTPRVHQPAPTSEYHPEPTNFAYQIPPTPGAHTEPTGWPYQIPPTPAYQTSPTGWIHVPVPTPIWDGYRPKCLSGKPLKNVYGVNINCLQEKCPGSSHCEYHYPYHVCCNCPKPIVPIRVPLPQYADEEPIPGSG